MIGAREGRPTWLRRLVANAAARTPAAFVVPGPEVARARCLDLEDAGLRIVTTPRHAQVLVLIGRLPPKLAEAATVAYAQMPRTRAILSLGAVTTHPLPAADVETRADQEALRHGVDRLRRLLEDQAWAQGVAPFDIPVVRPRDSDPVDGMDHAGMHHGAHAEMDLGHTDHGHMDQGGQAAAGAGAMQHGDHVGMGHEMHMGGFMSMVEMTKDLPRSVDGLPMEWIGAPFGPLFPGLPGGLTLILTLDGDTVARATLARGPVGRGRAGSWTGPAAGLPERLAALDPLAPVAYRVLALRVLEAIAHVTPGEAAIRARIGALERERAASHLNWLASLGDLLGYARLAREAAALQLAVLRAPDAAALARLQPRAASLFRWIRRSPLLARRLRGIGRINSAIAPNLRGPVARAMGIDRDIRADDPTYQSLGFVPVVCQGGDALARLEVRLSEIEQCLDLVAAAGTLGPIESVIQMPADGDGAAFIETPRGGALLHLTVRDGQVQVAALDSPSAAHANLVALAKGRELADALVAIASLDLSPWEIDR